MAKTTRLIFFILTILITDISLMFHAKFQPNIRKDVSLVLEKMLIFYFCYFSNRGNLGSSI